MELTTSHVAVVTGASRGIGRSIALALAARGDIVVVASRTRESLQAVVDETETFDGQAHAVVADMRSGEQVKSLFNEVRKRHGDVDILVTCAVQSKVAGFLELHDEDWIAHYETKVLGAIRCMREVVPAMSQQGWGRIVNLAGTTARMAGRGRATNGMTNAAITNVGKHVSEEFAHHGILVNTLHPGFTETPRLDMILRRVADRESISVDEATDRMRSAIPTGRFIEPDEISDLVLYLCSERNRSITGQVVAVDGGMAGTVTY